MSKETNRALWDQVFATDPSQVKQIIGKRYKGNSPKPHWLMMRATETFGPCGIAWGWTLVSQQFVPGTEGQIMHFAHVKLWYIWNGERGEVEQIGGTPYIDKTAHTDEDSPKKSITDAVTKCLSFLGFAGDIFMGRWDDSKYLQEVGAKYEDKKRQDKAKKTTPAQKREGDAVIKTAIQLLEIAAKQGFEHLAAEWQSTIKEPLDIGQRNWILKNEMPRIKKLAQEVGDARE